jgi:hypothetical protein
MKLFDTVLPEMYSKYLFEEKNTDLSSEFTDMLSDTLFTGTANILASCKSMEHPVAFTFTKLDGSFVAASIVQYFKNEDKDNPGNWSLVWTFDEKDVPESALKIDFNDPQASSYFAGSAGSKYGIRFESTASMINCLLGFLVCLKKYLDENAKEGAEVSVEQDGVFQARVVVENKEKVFALEVDGEIKNLIKDDKAIEK